MKKKIFKKKNMIRKFNNLIKVMLIFAFLILTVFPFKNVHAVVNAKRTADENTSNYYKNTISNKNLGTLYDDSIWSDKSVYTGNSITLDNKFKIENNDDFLTVFSTLGSSSTIKTFNALDVMFILDISTSMGGTSQEVYDFENSYIITAVESINSAVKSLLNINPKTRIGLTVYGTNAVVLMPLNNYELVDGTPFLKVSFLQKFSDHAFFNIEANAQIPKTKELITRYANNAGPSQTSYYGSEGLDGAKGSTGLLLGDGTKDSPWQVGRLTNHQAALAVGLDELASVNTTTTINKLGVARSNIPFTIHITDGQANDLAEISSDSNWFNVNPKKDIAFSTKIGDYYNFTALEEKNAVPLIFQTLMSASYYTSKVNKHYQANAAAVDDPNAKVIKVTNYSVYASDSDPIDEMADGINKTLINTICDPENNFTKDSENELINGTSYGEGAYSLFERWKKGEDINNKYVDYNNLPVVLNASQDQLANNKYGITAQDIIDNIYYVKKGNFLSTGFDELSKVLEKIIYTQSTSDLINPISDTTNTLNIKGSLSYVDPIGEYLELKSFKKAILFGDEYSIIKDKLTEEENVTKQYYKVVGNNNEDLTIINKSDKNLEFKLSDIIIYDQIVDNKHEIHINIPSNALPLKVDAIEMDGNNNVTTYVSNVDLEDALPIRFVYSVGVNDNYLKNNNIKISDISESYIQNNKNSNSLYFYSNTYSKNEYDKKTIGDAYVTFVPSETNKFYFIQKNYPIFKKSSSGEGILKSSGGNVELTEQLKDLNEIKKDELYYIEYEYFVPTTEDTFKGKLVKYAMEVKGSDFYDSKGNLLITYYDEIKGEETNNKSDNTIITTKTGICIERIIDKLSIAKPSNLTNTAAYSSVTQFIDGNIKTNLGNNGVIIADSNTGGEILVNPKTGVFRPTSVLIVLGILGVLLYCKLRKKSSYEI